MVQDRILTMDMVCDFERELTEQEKSPLTISKYLRDIGKFRQFVAGRPITKELTVAYKQYLVNCGYALASVNSMLAAVNRLMDQAGWAVCKVKVLRTQRRTYCVEEKILTKEEYMRLVRAADSELLKLTIQTICSTGIRISELKYFTIETIKRGEVDVNCKNKRRSILLPGALRRKLLDYAKRKGIRTGAIFVGQKGNPLDRSTLWKQMKNLCQRAQVSKAKVFPHNLRKLFARTYYNKEKDIAKLADLLGHSSINTTRIYIMETGREHRRQIEQMGLIL